MRECYSIHLRKTKIVIPAQLPTPNTKYVLYLLYYVPFHTSYNSKVFHSIRENVRLNRELAHLCTPMCLISEINLKKYG